MSIATEIERIKTAKESIINTLKSKNIEINENAKINEVDLIIKEVPIIDTTDATATEEDILEGKTAYVNGEKITGTLTGGGSSGSEYNVIIDPSLVTSSTGSNNTNLFNQMMIKLPTTIDLSELKSTAYLFNNCRNLAEIPELYTDNSESMARMFYDCELITTIPKINTSKVTNMTYMFYQCYKLTEIPELNTGNVSTLEYIFFNCRALNKIPELDFSKVNTVTNSFNNCLELLDLGGFLNLGKGYVRTSNNYSMYSLAISQSTKLTHESLMNVINKLYDLNLTYNVANGGTLYTQQLQLGSTNRAKLTSEEIAIATAKGWSVS